MKFPWATRSRNVHTNFCMIMKISHSIIVSCVTLLLLASSAFAAERFVFDTSQTIIAFSGSFLGFTDITGSFSDYDGYFSVNKRQPEASRIRIILKSSGIRTGSRELDTILQGEYWFNSRQFPEIRFVSTKLQKRGRVAILTGNLTVIGQTKSITLTIRPEPVTDSNQRCFNATGRIDLSDFGMDYSIPLKVRLTIHAVGIRQ